MSIRRHIRFNVVNAWLCVAYRPKIHVTRYDVVKWHFYWNVLLYSSNLSMLLSYNS